MHERFESQHPGCSSTTSCGYVGSLPPSETATVSALQGSMRAHVLSNIHPFLRSLRQGFWVPTFYYLKISNFEKTTTKMIFTWFNAAYFFSTSSINLLSALLRFLTSRENTSKQWLLEVGCLFFWKLLQSIVPSSLRVIWFFPLVQATNSPMFYASVFWHFNSIPISL